MPTLKDVLAQAFAPIIDDLASKTAEALQSMPLEDVLAALGLERRSAPRVAKRVRNRAKATTKPTPTRKVDADAVLRSLTAKLKANPKGLSGEQLQKDLGINRGTWRKVMAMALKAMRKTGEKRATKYFAK